MVGLDGEDTSMLQATYFLEFARAWTDRQVPLRLPDLLSHHRHFNINIAGQAFALFFVEVEV